MSERMFYERGKKMLTFHQIGFNGEYRQIVFRRHNTGAMSITFQNDFGHNPTSRRLGKDEVAELLDFLKELS